MNPEITATSQVTLCDGRPGIRALLEIETRAPSETPPADNAAPAVLDFIASNDALDRYGEILEPRGWRLENYRRNPVFQNAHQYGDIIFTLGRALVTEVRDIAGRAALCQRIEFAVDANPMARIAYRLYQGKFLNAVSVGFIPLRWQDAGDADASGTAGARAGCKRRYLEQELLEVSAVGIPANPEALQLGLRAGAIQKADLQELLELLQHTLQSFSLRPQGPDSLLLPLSSNPAGIAANTSALGRDTNEAQLLRLAHALRQFLGRA